jgi:methyltransferase (TIGR00027 family)
VLARDDVSRTARLVAACRALDGGRILTKPDTGARTLAGDEALARAATMPALVTGVALRTRWIDEHVLAFAAAAGAPCEIVLVGAGLDTRAARLGLEGATFLELDLPGMLACKRAAVGTAPGQLLLPADLRVERVSEVRARAPGRDPSRPTCAIWEGVSYYLSRDVAGRVLADLAGVIGPTGLLLLDYVTSRWMDAALRADRALVSDLARWGEPMVTGFDDLAAALAPHGLEVLEDVATEALLERYGHPPATLRWYAGRMAAARVRR